MDRIDFQFPSGADRCAAWLYRPASDGATAPAIVMAHGLSGTRRDRLGAFAERFAVAGIAALVFDHRGFGDSTGEADVFDPARQLEDWAAALAFVRTLPRVDPARVATFGSSMGGGNALAAAAADRRVAAAISQVPLLDLPRQAHRSPPGVTARMLGAAARGDFLPAVGQPDEPAFINAPDSEAGWRHVVAIGEDSRWRNRVSARWLLGHPYRPARHAATLHCPWLVCVGGADQVAKPGPAIAAARRAPHGELRVYPGVDHFDIYDGPEHEAVVADELAFLRRHLLRDRAAGERGNGSPLHRHLAEEETFFVLDGEVRVEVGGEAHAAGPGPVAFLPRQLPHAFVVTSPQAHFLTLHTPGGFDRFTLAVGTPAADTTTTPPEKVPPDPAALAAMASSYGIEILGPPRTP